MPSGILVPNFQPTVWAIISVCANQFVRSSGPSTPSLKSFCALIWLSQLIGGVKSLAPSAAFLNRSLISGVACRPAPEENLPLRNANQRPISSSRARNCATKLRSLSRSRKAGCRHACHFRSSDKANRIIENFTVAIFMNPLPSRPATILFDCPPRRLHRSDTAVMQGEAIFPNGGDGDGTKESSKGLCCQQVRYVRRFSRWRIMPVSRTLVLDLDQGLVHTRQQDRNCSNSHSRKLWFDRNHKIEEEK